MSVRVVFGSRAGNAGMAICAVALIALAAAPFWGGRDDLLLLSEIYAYVALASLWNLLAGYAGLVSVGQQAYVGLGAYLLFALAIRAGLLNLVNQPEITGRHDRHRQNDRRQGQNELRTVSGDLTEERHPQPIETRPQKKQDRHKQEEPNCQLSDLYHRHRL